MAELIIHTEAVLKVADEISAINDKIKEKYEALEKQIQSLDNKWDGPASDAGIAKFESLKKEFCGNRDTALENYINFLKSQVVTGYEYAEENNIKLSDKFK